MRVNFEVVQQATWRIGLEFLNDDGTPIDLDGATLTLRAVNTVTPAFTLTQVGTVLDAPNGLAEVVIPSNVTGGMVPGRWDYNLFLERAGFLEDDVPFMGALNVLFTIGGTP